MAGRGVMPAYHRQGQSFLGIRSGLTGATIIMLFVWRPVGKRRSALHLRLRADIIPEEEVLGYVEYAGMGDHKITVVHPNGSLIRRENGLSTTDAAMDILQYLSDIRDARLHLDQYPMQVQPLRGHGWGRGHGPLVDKWTQASAWV